MDPKETIKKYIKFGEIRFIIEEKRENKGGRYIVLLDVSGSMIGEKIFEAKKALLILTEKILEDHNLLDIILFNDKILKEYKNVKGFEDIIDILKIIPNGSTDISMVLNYILNNVEENSHIILITDALPTSGEEPVQRTLEAARKLGNICYISIIGIQLNKEGEEIAKYIVKYGNGRLFIVKNLEDLKKVILIEYELSKQ
ncbi:MAG: VWA domain-containing protein [Nanopusillaceae archaeon]